MSDAARIELNIPWTERPDFEQLVMEADLSEDDSSIVRRFAADGLVVIDPEIDPAVLDAVLAELRTERPKLESGEVGRVLDAWSDCPAVQRLATWPRILELLELLYRRAPIPFQTLNFERGTQQRLHADSIHFQTYPHNWMAGVWVALEDVTPTCGPLQYVPGSHRVPPLLDPTPLDVIAEFGPAYEVYENYVQTVIDGLGLRTESLLLRRGQAVVWSANVLHGGGAIEDERSTRRSQVTHYYFPGVTYYTPMFSDVFAGEIHFRTKELVDIRTGIPIPHYYKGNPFDPKPAAGVKIRPASQGGGTQQLGPAARARKMADEFLLPPALGRYLRRRRARN